MARHNNQEPSSRRQSSPSPLPDDVLDALAGTTPPPPPRLHYRFHSRVQVTALDNGFYQLNRQRAQPRPRRQALPSRPRHNVANGNDRIPEDSPSALPVLSRRFPDPRPRQCPPTTNAERRETPPPRGINVTIEDIGILEDPPTSLPVSSERSSDTRPPRYTPTNANRHVEPYRGRRSANVSEDADSRRPDLSPGALLEGSRNASAAQSRRSVPDGDGIYGSVWAGPTSPPPPSNPFLPETQRRNPWARSPEQARIVADYRDVLTRGALEVPVRPFPPVMVVASEATRVTVPRPESPPPAYAAPEEPLLYEEEFTRVTLRQHLDKKPYRDLWRQKLAGNYHPPMPDRTHFEREIRDSTSPRIKEGLVRLVDLPAEETQVDGRDDEGWVLVELNRKIKDTLQWYESTPKEREMLEKSLELKAARREREMNARWEARMSREMTEYDRRFHSYVVQRLTVLERNERVMDAYYGEASGNGGPVFPEDYVAIDVPPPYEEQLPTYEELFEPEKVGAKKCEQAVEAAKTESLRAKLEDEARRAAAFRRICGQASGQGASSYFNDLSELM